MSLTLPALLSTKLLSIKSKVKRRVSKGNKCNTKHPNELDLPERRRYLEPSDQPNRTEDIRSEVEATDSQVGRRTFNMPSCDLLRCSEDELR